MKVASILMTAGLLAGCTYSLEPLGTEPQEIDPAEWEGTWQALDDDVPPLEVEVVDAAGGQLRITGYDEDGERHEVDAVVRRLGDRSVVSVSLLGFEDIPQDAYAWALVAIDGNNATLQPAGTDAFRELVGEGWLPGDEHDGDLTVGFLEPHHLDLIAERRGTLFEAPQMMRRTSSLSLTSSQEQ